MGQSNAVTMHPRTSDVRVSQYGAPIELPTTAIAESETVAGNQNGSTGACGERRCGHAAQPAALPHTVAARSGGAKCVVYARHGSTRGSIRLQACKLSSGLASGQWF